MKRYTPDPSGWVKTAPEMRVDENGAFLSRAEVYAALKEMADNCQPADAFQTMYRMVALFETKDPS